MGMEEVDRILLQNFSALGWEAENEICSLGDLEVSDIAKLMVKCLYAINSECDLPTSLPYNMAQKFRVAAAIAEEIKNLGYHGDLGYQTILYSNETELRKIFMFLIEKLPKDSPSLIQEPLGKCALVQKEAKKKLSEILQRPWVPPHCMKVARKYKSLANSNISLTEHGVFHCHSFRSSPGEWDDMYINNSFVSHKDVKEHHLPIFRTPGPKTLPTLLNGHAEQLGRLLSSSKSLEIKKESVERTEILNIMKKEKMNLNDLEALQPEFKKSQKNSKLIEKVGDIPPSTTPFCEVSTKCEIPNETDLALVVKEKQRVNETKLNALESEFLEYKRILEGTTTQNRTKNKDIQMVEESLKKESLSLAEEEKSLISLRKTSSLAANAEENLGKLLNNLKASEDKYEKLENQWLEYKKPLELELQEIKSKSKNKKNKKMEVLNDISELRNKIKALAAEANKKETILTQLKQKKESLNKGVNRSVYTKQILDISAKVRKQKQEVVKVLSETRIIQKEINSLTGKLERTFAVVEDASFKAASTNERARPIYRAVIAIHEEFGALINVIRETGSIQREIADLEEQLLLEKSKNVEDNLKKLQLDFNRIKTENAALKKSIYSSA